MQPRGSSCGCQNVGGDQVVRGGRYPPSKVKVGSDSLCHKKTETQLSCLLHKFLPRHANIKILRKLYHLPNPLNSKIFCSVLFIFSNSCFSETKLHFKFFNFSETFNLKWLFSLDKYWQSLSSHKSNQERNID